MMAHPMVHMFPEAGESRFVLFTARSNGLDFKISFFVVTKLNSSKNHTTLYLRLNYENIL